MIEQKCPASTLFGFWTTPELRWGKLSLLFQKLQPIETSVTDQQLCCCLKNRKENNKKFGNLIAVKGPISHELIQCSST